MRAMILAAGQGTRLRPYTDTRPKCLVELAGRSLLERQLRVLRDADIDPITVIAGYRADAIDVPGVRKILNPRFDSTNMVATLFCAADAMSDGEDLLISYGDIVYEQKVLDALLACDAPLCLTADVAWQRYWQLRMEDPLADAETFKMTADRHVLELGRKPRSLAEIQAQYMGLIKVRGDRVEQFRAAYADMDRNGTYDGKNFDNMFMTSFLQYLIDQGWETRAALTENGWLEVDTTEDLDRYHALQASGKLADYCRLDD